MAIRGTVLYFQVFSHRDDVQCLSVNNYGFYNRTVHSNLPPHSGTKDVWLESSCEMHLCHLDTVRGVRSALPNIHPCVLLCDRPKNRRADQRVSPVQYTPPVADKDDLYVSGFNVCVFRPANDCDNDDVHNDRNEVKEVGDSISNVHAITFGENSSCPGEESRAQNVRYGNVLGLKDICW